MDTTQNTNLLEQFGLSSEDIAERVTERLVTSIEEEQGAAFSGIEERVSKAVSDHVEARLSTVTRETVEPIVAKLLDSMTFKQTNRYGEKQGPERTLREYIDYRLGTWMLDEVNHNGKTRDEEGYSWTKHGTRLAWMVNAQIADHIHARTQAALQDLNKTVGQAIAETVKIQLGNVLARLGK